MEIFITEYKNKIMTAVKEGSRVVSLDFEDPDSVKVGDIYVGKVINVVKNINAAFVEFAPGISGYYNLDDNKKPLFTCRKEGKNIASGDTVLVQVAKENMRMKQYMLTSNISLAGKYAIVTANKPYLGISAKITDEAKRSSLRSALSDMTESGHGIILRTQAENAAPGSIREEAAALTNKLNDIIEKASMRTVYSCILKADHDYINVIKGMDHTRIERVVTDIKSIYDDLSEKAGDIGNIKFYDDPDLPLFKLQSFSTVIERALAKKVWLRSGGFLVIEPTEAMVVIDVNTGKYTSRRDARESILKINKEAAAEALLQLRLRNLAGIIIIDFIDMKDDADREQVLKVVKERAALDPQRINVLDFTALGLLELTRKKIKKPIYEELGAKEQQEDILFPYDEKEPL